NPASAILVREAGIQGCGTEYGHPAADRNRARCEQSRKWWRQAVSWLGGSFAELYRRAASHVHKILQGTSPADLPVEQAIKFELVLNLNTAKALGIEIPSTLLACADEVIE